MKSSSKHSICHHAFYRGSEADEMWKRLNLKSHISIVVIYYIKKYIYNYYFFINFFYLKFTDFITTNKLIKRFFFKFLKIFRIQNSNLKPLKFRIIPSHLWILFEFNLLSFVFKSTYAYLQYIFNIYNCLMTYLTWKKQMCIYTFYFWVFFTQIRVNNNFVIQYY